MKRLTKRDLVNPLWLTNPFILRHNCVTFVVNVGGLVEFKTVTIEKPDDIHFILGQLHFIRIVEDICEAVSGSVPGSKCGPAFCDSSGDCLVRIEGNDEELKAPARDNAGAIGAGHSFGLFLTRLRPHQCPECDKKYPGRLYNILRYSKSRRGRTRRVCAGSGIMGVIDGGKPEGVEYS